MLLYTSSSQQESPITSSSNLPTLAKIILYDLLQEHKRDSTKLSSRRIPRPHVAKVTKNHLYKSIT